VASYDQLVINHRVVKRVSKQAQALNFIEWRAAFFCVPVGPDGLKSITKQGLARKGHAFQRSFH